MSEGSKEAKMIVLNRRMASRQLALFTFLIATAIPLVAARPLLGQQVQDQAQPPWVGAWHWLHETQDGRLLLTENWFCGVFGAKDRLPPQGAQPTEAEAAVLFRSMPGPMCGPVNVRGTEGEWVIETVVEVSARPRNRGRRTQRPTRVVGDLMSGDVMEDDGTVSNTCSYQRLSDPGGSLLAGTWELVSNEWDGMLLMTDTEYRYVIAQKDRASIEARTSQLPDREAALLYHSYDAQGESYSLSGSMITWRPAIARNPREQGREILSEVTVDGETLATGTGDQQWRWRKID